MADRAARAGGPVRVLRVIARVNVGGPALHVAQLSAPPDAETGAGGLGPGYETTLAAGHVGPDEREATAVLARHGVQLVRLPRLGRAPGALRDLESLRALRHVIRRVRPHVVHSHTSKAGVLARLAARRERGAGDVRPAIAHTFHGHVFRGHLGRVGSRAAVAVERRLARRTDAVVAVSQQIADDLVDAYAVVRRGRVHVVPLGVPCPEPAADDVSAVRPRLGIPADAPLVVLVGRLVPVKRTLLALASFALARETVPEAHLVVVGGGPDEAACRAAAGENVHVIGWQDDPAPYQAAADVALLTSAMEGSPVALIEAALLGRPAVATNVGGVPSVVVDGETGLLVRAGDAVDVAAALVRLLRDAPLRARLGEAAAQRARERYAPARMLAAHRALYERLLRAQNS